MGKTSRAYGREWKRKARQKRAISGICVDCPAAKLPDNSRCARCVEKCAERAARWMQKQKQGAISAYGGSCACCGEANIKFLTIDHIEGKGNEHRRTDPSAITIYRWLKKRGYPDGFRVLCYNCNCGRTWNKGRCPHEESR